jgi:hypothetical protein
VRPGGHQRGARAVLGVVVLDGCLWLEAVETRLSGFEVVTSLSRPLSWSLSSLLEPSSALMQPPLGFSPHQALLHHRPKSHSVALFAPDCNLIDQQMTHSSMLLAHVVNRELQQLPRRLDGSVWHSGLSNFPDLGPFCPAGGRRVRNDHLLCSSLHSQNPE